MKSRTRIQDAGGGRDESEAATNDIETPTDSDESSDLDEFDIGDADDHHWDAFILDDDCDPHTRLRGLLDARLRPQPVH